MPALTSTASTLARTCARQQLPAVRVASASLQKRSVTEVSNTSSFDSPFKGGTGARSTKIPNFSRYMNRGGETSNKVFQYFMVGTFGALTALGAKATVQGGLALQGMTGWAG